MVGHRRRSKRICSKTKRTKILPYIPSKDRERRNRQLDSLRYAMEDRNLDFSNELTYPEDMAPKSANQSKSECDDMQVQILNFHFMINTLFISFVKLMFFSEIILMNAHGT